MGGWPELGGVDLCQFYDSLSGQLSARMNLPRIARITLLLNPIITTTLAQFHSYINLMINNRHTSNLLSI